MLDLSFGDALSILGYGEGVCNMERDPNATDETETATEPTTEPTTEEGGEPTPA
jgi:hypothetical protein